MSYDRGMVERVAGALQTMRAGAVRQRNVFGGRGFLVGKSTFVIVWGDGIIVKMPAAEYGEALTRPGVTPFMPGGDRPMTTWVVVGPDVVADDPELLEWVASGLRAVR
jgi:TfoX/Sxy family transcriptional regulator of competence genes